VRSRRGLPGAPRVLTPAQRRPMRVWGLSLFVLADLPVDVVVVLEQQERAGQAKRIERPLGKRRCSR
jgi:hypothetical protein